MKHSLGKILSALLAIAMVLGMLPVWSFAAEETDPYIADCPSFILRGPEGVYPLENYGENGILLFFGRSSCANTRALMGELNGRIEALEAQGVQVFANLEDTYIPEDYADMVSLYPNITYTYSDGVLRKILFKLVEPESDGFYFPLVLVINPEGQIIHYSTGYVSDLQTLLSKVEAVSTGNPLPEPEPTDENYYGTAYRYTGDDEALARIIRQQLAAKTPDIVIYDGTWDGTGDSWTGEALAYTMFDILEAAQEEYGPYMIPDTWTYYPWAQQVVISLIYAKNPEEPEPVPDVLGGSCGENLTWTLDEEGTLTVSGTGSMANYDTEDAPWVEQQEEIKRVVLEEGVTEIGAYAFVSCTNLTSVTISGTVRTIGSNAFLSCGLTEVTIPEGVTRIGDAAFENCGHLTDITIAASVTHIGPSAFYGCRSLTTVHYGGTEEQKEDISIIPENKPLTDANWHYQCDGETCESTDPEESVPDESIPEESVPKESKPEDTDPEETKPTEPVYDNPFADVAALDYYYTPVLWAVENGITNGLSADSFGPMETCTRAQIVTFLWRSKGSPAPASADNPFTDVPADQWYTDAVLWAVEKGITTGTSETTFSPDMSCNRGQVATFLWRAEGKPGVSGENIFTDVPLGEYYYDAVLWAVANEVTNGMGDGLFAPEATCTRGQIVTFLHRAML